MTLVAAILNQQLHVIPLLLGYIRVNPVQTGNRNAALSQAGLDQSLRKPREYSAKCCWKETFGGQNPWGSDNVAHLTTL